MQSLQSFHGYLRLEVDNAEKNYELAKERVFRLTGGPEITDGPALLKATEELAEAMRIYISALRRLAHFASHQGFTEPQKQLATYA